jgi:hypothetical protein
MRTVNVLAIQRISARESARITAVDPAVWLVDACSGLRRCESRYPIFTSPPIHYWNAERCLYNLDPEAAARHLSVRTVPWPDWRAKVASQAVLRAKVTVATMG